MKMFCLCFAVVLTAAISATAQSVPQDTGLYKDSLPVVFLPNDFSLHFVSPEPIQYVDISVAGITGDLPLKNILRIRRKSDLNEKSGAPADAVVTIVGQSFLAQYRVLMTAPLPALSLPTEVEISPAHIRPLDVPGTELPLPQLRKICLAILSERRAKNGPHSRQSGIKSRVNHLYTLGDYFFIDLSLDNATHLSYAIDQLRFKLEDEKVTKATNIQSLEVKPELVLFDEPGFKKHYRNIFVFKKFTFPGTKLLHVEISEKQLSGRDLRISITYRDVLAADTPPAL